MAEFPRRARRSPRTAPAGRRPGCASSETGGSRAGTSPAGTSLAGCGTKTPRKIFGDKTQERFRYCARLASEVLSFFDVPSLFHEIAREIARCEVCMKPSSLYIATSTKLKNVVATVHTLLLCFFDVPSFFHELAREIAPCEVCRKPPYIQLLVQNARTFSLLCTPCFSVSSTFRLSFMNSHAKSRVAKFARNLPIYTSSRHVPLCVCVCVCVCVNF